MDKSCSKIGKELLQYGDASKKINCFFRLKSEFDFVKNNSVKHVSKSMIILFADSEKEHLKIGIICGRKFCNKAVVRNRVRRIIKESFRLLWNNIKPAKLLIIPRRGAECLKTQDIQRELISTLKRMNLWKEEQTL
ncbi:MAG TPA: ribonuclease P protein component [Lentisphaeria bacterium]|nr:MAG: ribonuclease P protein component [Lentisphaerae bacterium GWF2_38_69]HBM15005.1 ribonuclease P protein component [Lentisphaeria bacterium]